MEISLSFQNFNWIAIFCAALSTFIIGGIWYAMFEKPWMEANNFSKEDLQKRNMILVFGLSLVLSYLIAISFATFIKPGDAKFGAKAGLWIGLVWVTLSLGVIALFENRPLKYVFVNGGYVIASFTAMGAILGGWK